MVALDTSAIIAILIAEPEEFVFLRTIKANGAVVGAPTLVEARLMLEGRAAERAEELLRAFLASLSPKIARFDVTMFESAIDAFARYGKGRGHPANLNFGDCLSYAVAKTHAVPLLFKGGDFVHTDLVPAYAATP